MRFVLASASAGRLAVLRAAGVEPEVVVSGVEEDDVTGPPGQVALVLARRKATAVRDRVGDPDALVLGCDSVLELDGVAHGKPADAAEARQRWRGMSGREGVLHTGHCLVSLATGRHAEASAATTVHFADLDDDEIDAYVHTGEPLEVAGAFTIDGIGGPFITALEGDHGTVVGLSLPTLRRLLAEHGIRITDLWKASA